eukprot:688443-Rhodomonas_salina.1
MDGDAAARPVQRSVVWIRCTIYWCHRVAGAFGADVCVQTKEAVWMQFPLDCLSLLQRTDQDAFHVQA